MKLASYSVADRPSFGCVTPDGVVGLASRLGLPSLRALLASGRLAEAARFATLPPDHALDAVTWLPVIPDPQHFYCVGVNYADHLREVQQAGVERPKPKQPSLFIRFPETLVGHGRPLLIPSVSEQLDYEAELAVIIGTGGRNIAKEQALAHVAGYACFNDGSVRDWQFHSSQVTSGKNFPGTGGFGPAMVTADEIPDPSGLDIRLVLDGRVLQSSNTRELIFDVPTIISYASALVPLQPGDVIATGTPAGVGFSRQPPIFMKPGQICEVQIERVGMLRNAVARDPGPA